MRLRQRRIGSPRRVCRSPGGDARWPSGSRSRSSRVLGAAAYLSDESQWKPVPLTGLIAVLVLGSDLLVLDAKRFRIGGSFTGLVLAMALLGPAPAALLGLASALVDALRRKVRGTYLLNNLLTYTTFPLLGGIVLTRDPRRRSQGGRLRGRGLPRLPRHELPELPDDRRAHADPARRVAGRDVPRCVRAGAAVGDRLGGDDLDGGLRLRGLRPRDHRPVRARARRLPTAAARAAGGPGALGGDRAPHRPAGRPPRGDARPAARDAGVARPERRPPRRRGRPLRARARARGRPLRTRAGGRPHRRACCTISARRRCPTTS